MPGAVRRVWLPEMELVMVRRASARLPKNNYIFRTSPKWTKPEIKQYIEALYGAAVARIATINYLGKIRTVGRIVRKRKDFKKVYVQLAPEQKPPSFAPIDYGAAPTEWRSERAVQAAAATAAATAVRQERA